MRQGAGSRLALGYVITALDVWGAYHATIKAAEALRRTDKTRATIRGLVAAEPPGGQSSPVSADLRDPESSATGQKDLVDQRASNEVHTRI